jgi:hypothetical protein
MNVRDVIGEPETWPNHLHVAGEGPTDIRGATISQVFAAGTDLAVCTEGGACGATFTVFAVEDKGLRDRVERALRLGLDVHEAATAEI